MAQMSAAEFGYITNDATYRPTYGVNDGDWTDPAAS